MKCRRNFIHFEYQPFTGLLEKCEGRRDKYGNGSLNTLNTRLHIPKYPKVGDRVVLGCKYDLGRDGSLYTVKWYKGNQEFYRYTPKESPAIKTFEFPGTEVDVSLINLFLVILGTPVDFCVQK